MSDMSDHRSGFGGAQGQTNKGSVGQQASSLVRDTQGADLERA